MPFTTNRKFAHGATTAAKVIEVIQAAACKYFPRIRYILVQAAMSNQKEYKLVLIGGKVLWKSVVNHTPQRLAAFSPRGHKVLIKWAENALRALHRSCPQAICDGLVRVDIFQTISGSLVVNEFESFEADVDGTDREFGLQTQGLEILAEFYVAKFQKDLIC